MRGCVLVLPGGRVRSEEPSRWWQPANLRMVFLARALRRRLDSDIVVRRVQYRLRGWNSPQRDPVHDAAEVLRSCRLQWAPEKLVLVGHSMGGRVAAQLAAGGGIDAVVALAPWWAGDKGDLIPPGTRLLVVHGTADTRTDPGISCVQTQRASRRGLDARWVGITGAGHAMVRNWREWHSHTTDFVAQCLAGQR
ncbi:MULTISPECIES: alpha/beta fold hydrolase [unclassified Mycobacterium]|uniref:alpha/beta fold hydrolase n=1 Tax=unclassified Mycobacterium TaxID=2642494 RepID=UPI002741230D|nr:MULTISPECIES: alpha/beta fold hydrolase [unclassified Mycobacterium]MDP7701537.1 alpha/beta fold hydrolase [Mycobacterium sp. TY815]MDP7724400.1 alpha/beta fold hydrolase [Mycobacterium sp. TY814]